MTGPVTDELADALDEVARDTEFSGVVRVDRPGEESLVAAYGLADRAHGIAMTAGHRFAVASGAKSFTALTVLRLIEDGALSLDTRARELLGNDLPLIDDAVTVEHLLSHRSGIGDYFDEEAVEDDLAHVLTVPVHTLDTAEAYLPILDGFPQVSEPGSTYAYNNGAFCVLAILAGRGGGRSFHDLVRDLVIEPAGLTGTAYLRSDELPGDAAVGYLEATGLRTNVLHLPVLGGGDGGIFTTADDVHQLWQALEDGRVVAGPTRDDAWRSRTDLPDEGGYGLGFFRNGPAVEMHGADVGASFRSAHARGRFTWTVLSNTTYGAWPVIGRLDELISPGG